MSFTGLRNERELKARAIVRIVRRIATCTPNIFKHIGLLALLPILLSACASSGLAAGYATPILASSPTPFQPGSLPPDSPFDGISTLSATESVDESGIPLEVSIEATPTSSLPNVPIFNLSVDINPLTGLPPADPLLLERRPLAIKVSLYPRAIRPEFGLTSADQVFEYYIEWGDSRFIAIFYGKDAKQVGPVRSGRYFDAHITRMYHSFYVFNFADPRELGYFKGTDIAPFMVTPGCNECACPPFFVFNPTKLQDENHLTSYFDTTRASACFAKKTGVDNARPPLRSGFFSELIPNADYKVQRIYTKYSNDDYDYWQYDAATLKYLRFQETAPTSDVTPEAYAPLMDAGTGLQVNAENVVELFVPHTFANQFDAADEVYHINLEGSGLAYVFRDGLAIPARWQRTAVDQPLFLTTQFGSPIFLRPGVTFYEVVGASSGSYQDNDGWHFEFLTP